MERTRYIIIALGAFVCLLLAISLEHPQSFSALFSLNTLKGLTKEIAFALLIGLLVIAALESESRRQIEKLIDDHRALLGRDVYLGVFSRNLDKKYVDAAISVNLEPNLIRKHLEVNYSLEKIPAHILKKRSYLEDQYIFLKVRMEFYLFNPNPFEIVDTLTMTNPHLTGYQFELSHIEALWIGEDRASVSSHIGSVMVEDLDDQTIYKWPITLKPYESKYVEVKSTLLKDVSDNHIWGSTRPTEHTSVSVKVNIPNMRFGLRFLTASPAHRVNLSEDGADAKWDVSGPMCPNDSFVLWWRQRHSSERKSLVSPEAARVDVLREGAGGK